MADGKDGFEALTIGRRVSFSKTVSESDVYLFAGITGDLSPNHVDEEYMRTTRYGRRIAHGALAVGLMSNASTRVLEGLSGTCLLRLRQGPLPRSALHRRHGHGRL